MNKKASSGANKKNDSLTPWERYQLQNGSVKRKEKVFFFRDKKLFNKFIRKSHHNSRIRTRNDQIIFFVLLIITVTLIISMSYFASPFSKINQIKISGDNVFSKTELNDKLGIGSGKSIWKVYGKEHKLVDGIKRNYPQIESSSVKVDSINNLNINTKEYPTAGYLQVKDGYKPILGNGIVLNDLKMNNDTDLALLKNFYNGHKLEEMLSQYKNLSVNIQRMISIIIFTPTSINPERVHLIMKNKNQVYASIGTFADKMRFYPSISEKSKEPQIINFELGAYSYPLSQVTAEKINRERKQRLQKQRRLQIIKQKKELEKKNKKLQQEEKDNQ